jgi:DNA-binding MarR family transcriptional regulator
VVGKGIERGDIAAAQAVRALVRVSRVLERASPHLSLPQYRVLAAVAAGEEQASRVAARLALGKPAVSAAVEALCHRGLLSRSDMESDLRAACLRLTPSGDALLGEFEAAMTARLEQLVERCPDPGGVLDALGSLGPAIDAELAEKCQ